MNDILQYESKIWATADLLRGVGIKESDFPKYMMPFFALVMVESRLIRYAKELEEDLGRDDIEGFVEEFQDFNIGYNDFVIHQQKTLKDLCKNDKTFDVDFHAYLKSFDQETKSLLGVDKGTEEEKFLDISGISGLLKKKRVLFATVRAWSLIDLVPFNNSDITTLEEHIKRRWADISAETAGEQYTPDDIIALISEIIASKLEDNGQFLTIYDGTCGGGNLLFGVEDKIKKHFPTRPTATYGQDWNDALYALAKIESRFRTDSHIEYGNTLTDSGKFYNKKFDIANPPYGVDWKGFKDDIEEDQTGRFHALPSISDGQLLFTQHFLSKLDDEGIAVIVHNGSTLFSGDAGSGESDIRKWFFDNDWVEALIQMPTDEFFNTGIYTYLWVFNKNKPESREDKVIVINGSEQYEGLKKSRGTKRKQMNADNRRMIVNALVNFGDSEIARVFDKWHFYYNKQAIRLTNLDEDDNTFEDHLPVKLNRDGEEVRAKSVQLEPLQILLDGEQPITIDEFQVWKPEKGHRSLKTYLDDVIKPQLTRFDYREEDLKVVTKEATYWFDENRETLIKETKKDGQEVLGCGKIIVKASLKKKTTKVAEYIQISCELTPDYEKDHEIIPYSNDPAQNQQDIVDFMNQYISRPFKYLGNIVGVEINFNKVFYQPEELDSVERISKDLKGLEEELMTLERNLGI